MNEPSQDSGRTDTQARGGGQDSQDGRSGRSGRSEASDQPTPSARSAATEAATAAVTSVATVTLGSFLKEAREDAGIARRQLAAMSGVGRMTIQRLETDYYNEPSPDDLVRLARALELNETDLFLLAGIPVPKRVASLDVMLRTGYGVSAEEVPGLTRQIEALIAEHAPVPKSAMSTTKDASKDATRDIPVPVAEDMTGTTNDRRQTTKRTMAGDDQESGSERGSEEEGRKD